MTSRRGAPRLVFVMAAALLVSGCGGSPATPEPPAAPPEGTNDFGNIGWNGPCPPSGEHRYRFTLRALAAPLSLPGAPGGREVRDALDRSTILATAVLEARYTRQ